MTERIEIEGVSLTVDEARDVLAWVANPIGDLGDPVPNWLRWHGGPWVSDGGCMIPLTPALIEQIRDAVEPWDDADHREATSGGMARCRWGCGWRVFRAVIMREPGEKVLYLMQDLETGDVDYMPTEIQIRRRPRKPALTLGDVEPGQVVGMRPAGVERRALRRRGDADAGGVRPVLDEHTWTIEHWPLAAEVELLENDHE